MPEAPGLVPHTPKRVTRPQQSSTARGYGTAHRKARKRILAKFPICQQCGRSWSTDLHHVDHDVNNRADTNLLAVCEGCHHGVLHRG